MSALSIQGQSPVQKGIQDFQPDTFKKIFRNLSYLERSAPAMVCRAWNQYVRDTSLWLSNLDLLKCRVIDESVWKEHAAPLIETGELSFEGTRSIPKNDIVAIMKVSKFYARMRAEGLSIEGKQGLTILTIPKGLSMDLVQGFFEEHFKCKAGTFILHHLIEEKISRKFVKAFFERSIGSITNQSEEKVDQAYQVILTNDILTGTQKMPKKEQIMLLKKTKCILPRVLEAITLLILTKKSANTLLYSRLIFTRTSDYKKWEFEKDPGEAAFEYLGWDKKNHAYSSEGVFKKSTGTYVDLSVGHFTEDANGTEDGLEISNGYSSAVIGAAGARKF